MATIGELKKSLLISTTTLPKWGNRPITNRDDSKIFKAAIKYAHLIGLTIASKFFMLLSIVFLAVSSTDKAYVVAAWGSGFLWASCLLLIMICCLKELKKQYKIK